MQELATFEEILKMHPEKFVAVDDENRGRILDALAQEIFKLRTELEELKSGKTCEIVEKIVVLKDVSYSEAKSRVENYLKTHKKASYMYELSNELGLNLKMVHEIIVQLIIEGKVE